MWILYDFLDPRGRNVMQEWANDLGLDKKELARLNSKIDMLENFDPVYTPDLLSDTNDKNIKEICINGKVALRPLLCRGPIDMRHEFTFLLGAIEKDRKYKPKNALERARNNRDTLTKDRTRRTPHERFGGNS